MSKNIIVWILIGLNLAYAALWSATLMDDRLSGAVAVLAATLVVVQVVSAFTLWRLRP